MGNFFVNFEKKRLPVMVMRRILHSLVFKKRTAPGKSERKHGTRAIFSSSLPMVKNTIARSRSHILSRTKTSEG